MLKIIFTNEELIENKISKANFIVKEIIDAYITKSKDENAVMIFICQPIHEILSIIIQLSVILSNNEFNLIFIPGETYEIGAIVTHDGGLYINNYGTISDPDWVEEHWTQTSVGELPTRLSLAVHPSTRKSNSSSRASISPSPWATALPSAHHSSPIATTTSSSQAPADSPCPIWRFALRRQTRRTSRAKSSPVAPTSCWATTRIRRPPIRLSTAMAGTTRATLLRCQKAGTSLSVVA